MDKSKLYDALAASTDILTKIVCGKETPRIADQLSTNMMLLEKGGTSRNHYIAAILQDGEHRNVWLCDVHPTEYLLHEIERSNKIGPESPIPKFPVLVSYQEITGEQFSRGAETHINAPSIYSGVEIFTRANLDEDDSPEWDLDDDS